MLIRDMVQLPVMPQGSSKASGCFSGYMCTMQNRTHFTLFLQCLFISPSRFVRPYMPCSKLRQQVKLTHANWISRMKCAQGKVSSTIQPSTLLHPILHGRKTTASKQHGTCSCLNHEVSCQRFLHLVLHGKGMLKHANKHSNSP